MRHLLLAAVLSLSTSAAFAQETRPSLKIPTTVFLAAASADWITTGMALTTPGITEGNPLLGFTNNHPTGTVAALVVSDIVGTLLITKVLAPRKPKLARTLLYVFAGTRGAVAIHNARAISATQRR